MSNIIDENELFYQDIDDVSVDGNIESHLSTINTSIPDYGGIGVTSYKDYNYESEEAQTIIDFDNPPIAIAGEGVTSQYDTSKLFPDWIVNASDWVDLKGSKSSNEISDILQIPLAKRTVEHEATLIHWLMSVWEIARSMGFKKCGAMFKKFKYFVHEAGDDIMTEGESGYTFYIICSGEADIIKNGIGVVAHLGKGKCFGEIALTQGKTLRTATVRTTTTVEVLSLHKVDYDHFVKDLMQAERRENYFILKECKLFESWPRQTIEKMSSLCTRKSYEVDQYVFQQGDTPDCLYILVDGSFEIFKEITIICKNRWPTGNNKWSGCARKTMKPFLIQKLNQKSQYFGEHSIIKNTNRSATVQCKSKSVLLALDKLEFLHFLERGKSTSIKQLESLHSNYIKDDYVLSQIGHIKGGPTSLARVGSVTINPQATERVKEISHKAIKLEPIENHFKVLKTDVHLNFLTMNNPSEMLHKVNAFNNIAVNKDGERDDESTDFGSLVQSLLVDNKKKLKEEKEKRAMAFIMEQIEDLNCEYFNNDNNQKEDILGRNPSNYKNKSLKLDKIYENAGVEQHSNNPLSSVIPIEPPSQIILSTIKRDLARHKKFKFNGAYNVPLNAAVTSLQIITSTGRRMKAVSTTSLKQLQHQHDSQEEKKRAMTEERAANINNYQNNTTYTYPSNKPEKRNIKHLSSRLQDDSLVISTNYSTTGTDFIGGAEYYDDRYEHLNHLQLRSKVKQRPKSSSSSLMRPRKCNDIKTVIKPLDLLVKTKLSYRDVIGNS